jgi:endonuclease V-like protein UPF0215 family
MYAVVGCDECGALWIVEGRPETSQCPRCGKTRKYEKRRQFVTTDDKDHAREVRGSMLATRQGYGEEFADLDSFAEMEEYVDEAGIDDDTYLAASGIDPGETEAAAERSRQRTAAGGTSRSETVREALRELEAPDEDAVLAYASDAGVDPDEARKILEKLRRAGEVAERDGEYRLL